MTGEPALRTIGLGHRYHRRTWALRDCTLELPQGRIIGLVGANGAGKTTLLHLAIGLLKPAEGTVSMFGRPIRMDQPAGLAQVGFVAQDHPLYRGFTVADMIRFGRSLNPRFDQGGAERRLNDLGIPLGHKTAALSGGQQAQVALTLALAKQPRILVLDEPVASLDPLARREFLQDLMEAVAEQELSVVLSSHLVSDVERACDYLVVLVDSRVQVAGDIEHLLSTHHRLTGPRRDPETLPGDQDVLTASHTDRQSTYLVRTEQPILDPAWEVSALTLEDLVLAYMRGPEGAATRPTLEALR
jgi:ABC-2 type transport system ATP-binding protein